jgi:TonB family protein
MMFRARLKRAPTIHRFYIRIMSRIPWRRAFLAGFAVFLFACSRPPSVLKGSYPSGVPKYHVAVDSAGKKHGPETWWFDNGKARYQAQNVHGLRHGAYQAWYPNGNLWYQGRDSLGVHRDTLRAWRQDGKLQAIRVFQGGTVVYLESIDASGLSKEDKRRLEAEAEARLQDSAQAWAAARRNSLSLWSLRVRASVETYWIPPKRKGSVDHKSVARIRVQGDGRITDVTWLEKSAWPAFNEKAAKALRRMKKFPPLPTEAGAGPLDIRYEFVSLGKKPRAGKLQLRRPGVAKDETEEVGK